MEVNGPTKVKLKFFSYAIITVNIMFAFINYWRIFTYRHIGYLVASLGLAPPLSSSGAIESLTVPQSLCFIINYLTYQTVIKLLCRCIEICMHRLELFSGSIFRKWQLSQFLMIG